MGSVNPFPTIIVLALAPLIGFILARFTQEELAPGKNWFTLAKRVLFIAALFVTVYAQKHTLFVAVPGLLVIFAYLALPQCRTWWYAAAALGIAFSLAFPTTLQFLSAALVFLCSLPAGALTARTSSPVPALRAGALFAAVAVAVQFVL
jgi:uncharacterized membrane protein